MIPDPLNSVRKFGSGRRENYLKGDTPIKDHWVRGFTKINPYWRGKVIDEHELTNGKNIFIDRGIIKKTPGTSYYGTSNFGTAVHDLSEYINVSGTQKLCAVTSTNLYVYGGGTWTAIGTNPFLCSPRNKMEIVYSETVGDFIVIITNFSGNIKSYNGTSVSNLITAFGANHTKNLNNIQFYANIVEVPLTGTAYPNKVYWSDIGKPETITGGISGGLFLAKSPYQITNLCKIKGGLAVFQQYSMSVLQYTGSYTFPITLDEGILSLGCIGYTADEIDGDVIFLGHDKNVYITTSSGNIKNLTADMESLICDQMYMYSPLTNDITFCGKVTKDRKYYILSFQINSNTMNHWALNLKDFSWNPFNLFSSNNTIDYLDFITQVGGYGYTRLACNNLGYIYQILDTYYNSGNNNVIAEQYADTKDFVFNENLFQRFCEIVISAYGNNANIELYYSLDEGVNWNFVGSALAITEYKDLSFPLTVYGKKIRFRIRNNELGKYFNCDAINIRRIEKGISDAS